MKTPITLLAGGLFGLGLAVSDMVNPHTVLAFLTLQDLGLMLVLAVAVGINLMVFQLIPRVPTRLKTRPLCAETYDTRPFQWSRSALFGGVLFGIGWGISGVCPAPAFAGLGLGNGQMAVSLLAMLLGAGAHGWWANRSNKANA